MSIIELALAIALGIAIVVLAPVILLGLLSLIISTPCAIVEYFHDKKMEKELISKGAKNIKVKNGIIYQNE